MEWISKLDHEFVVKTLYDKFGVDFKYLLDGNTFEDVGMDDLDNVEFLMDIERKYDIIIKDEEWEIVEKDPTILFRSIVRDEKINKILEDE